MSDSASEQTGPAASFAVLADPLRIDILRALAADSQESVSFSVLHDRVGSTDSGRFNYHLNKLVGRFVAKDEDGYRLTTAGFQVYGAILAGTYTETTELEPFELSDDCPRCGHALEVRYVDEHLEVACPDCERVRVAFAFPPGAIEGRSPEELLDTLQQRLRATLPLAWGGICPVCWGQTTKTLASGTVAGTDEDALFISITCSRCGDELTATPGSLLLSEPAVIAAYHEAGQDLREQAIWTLPWIRREAVETLSTDPYRVQVTVEVGEQTLRATIEADATVSEIETLES